MALGSDGKELVEENPLAWLDTPPPEQQVIVAKATEPVAAAEPPKTGETAKVEAPKPGEEAKVIEPVIEEAKPADPNAGYIKQLHADRAKQDDIINRLLSEQTKLVEKLSAKEAKQLSPEEEEARVTAEREALLENPDAFLKKRDELLRDTLQKELSLKAKEEMARSLGYKSVDLMETNLAANAGLRTLEEDADAYPLMKDEAFRALLVKDTNLQEVFKAFDKATPAKEALGDKKFWMLAYQRATLAKVAGDAKTPPAKKDGEEPLPADLTASPPSNAQRAAAGAGGKPLEDAWAAVMAAGVKPL